MENNFIPVVILCGGKGSRMGELTEEYPKSLLTVGGHALLWYVIHHFRSFGFRRFVLPLGFGADKIRQWLDRCPDFNDCKFTLVETGANTPVTQRLDLVMPALKDETTFFLANSDTICRFDLIAGLEHHRASRKAVTLMTMPVRSHWGLILQRDEEVVAFERSSLIEKVQVSSPAGGLTGSINSGFAIINRAALEAELGWMRTMNDDNYEQDFYGFLAQQGALGVISMPQFWMAFDTKKDLIGAKSVPAVDTIEQIITFYKASGSGVLAAPTCISFMS